MLEQLGRSDDVCQLVKLLGNQISRFERLETGASPMDPYISETVGRLETTLLGLVSALRRIRNTEQPVNKLPPELLSQIFSFVPGPLHRCGKVDGLKRDFGPHAIATLADLLPLLNICSRWRSVATSSSFLWCTIDNQNPHAFSISSRYRPASGPLNAHVRDTFDPPHDDILRDIAAGMRQFHQLNAIFLKLLQNEGHRICEFNIEVPAILLPALSAFPGEALQTLQAVQPLFCGCTPKLKSLIVKSLLPEGPYTFINFLRFLSRCPNLEVLHLFALDIACLQDLPNRDVVLDAPQQLPRLRKFSNEESLTLNALPFDAPFTSLYLGGHGHPSELSTSEPNGVVAECFSLMATDPPRQRGIRVDFQMPGTRYAPRNVTTQSARACLRDGIRSAPLLAHVHELWAVPMAAVLLSEPCSLLSCLPHLATLVLGLYPLAPDAPDDVRDHWEPLRAVEVRDDCVIRCPRLRTLCVYVGADAEEHIVLLCDVLLSRGEAGYPVRRLVVGFYGSPTARMLELVEGLWGLVEDFTVLEDRERCPEDLLWVHRLPSVCRERSERNTYWPAWM
ncbi:hypothetical protein V8D89_002695 [Ganoderma adspersum]